MLPPFKILDFTRLLPGPLATLYLADLGAEVIKVEDTKQGDYARNMPPFLKNISPLYLLLNRNKKSIAIDFNQEDGQKIIHKLVENADVVIEGFKPGTMKKWNLDYESLKKIKPDLIYVSITGYGSSGKWAKRAGHDLNFLGYTGILHHLIKNGQVNIPPIQIADVLGGSMHAIIATLAALIHKLFYHEGQYIDISMLDATMANTHMMLNSFLAMRQELPPGHDLLTGGMPFYDVYPTKDNRFMVLGTIETKFWKLFCQTVQREDWLSQQFVFGEKAQKLRNEITELFKSKTQQEWIHIFENIDCCVTPVLNYTEAIHLEHFQQRNTISKNQHPTEGEFLNFQLSPFYNKNNQKRQAPAWGENTQEILNSLNYSDEQIHFFIKNKIILAP
ncbi:MAG: CoA transferase [Bacteroidia bacterium]|nr:MAG: CoA transferase [Bacteroidia bacterium]